MHTGTILLLGLATNLDNLCLGFSYGLAGKRISGLHNLLISGVSGLFAFFACAAASAISQAFRNIALIAGAVLLICIGIYSINAAFQKRGRTESASSVQDAGMREILLVGVVLGLNCLGASFGAGLAAVEPVWIGVSVFSFSFLSVTVGNLLGAKIKWLAGSMWLDVTSGVMFILIGLWELFL